VLLQSGGDDGDSRHHDNGTVSFSTLVEEPRPGGPQRRASNDQKGTTAAGRRQAKAATHPAPSPAEQALQEADRRLRPPSRFQVSIFISPVLATWPATKVNVPLDRLISVEFDSLRIIDELVQYHAGVSGNIERGANVTPTALSAAVT
jgi:hypothetical protein